jgi:hypothetical protein
MDAGLEPLVPACMAKHRRGGRGAGRRRNDRRRDVTLASIMAALFGGELLDPVGVPGIWFPFNIGVSRTQYVYAIAVPLVAFLIVRTLVGSAPAHGARR